MKAFAAITTSLALTSCTNLPAILQDSSVRTIDDAIHIQVDSSALYSAHPVAVVVLVGGEH